MTKYGTKGTLMDDMDIIRKLCLTEKSDAAQRNASSIALGTALPEKMVSSHMADYADRPLCTEPKSTRDNRSRYMNSKHFDMGYHDGPLVSESGAAFLAHAPDPNRNIAAIGGRNNKNASSLFANPKDRGEWVDDVDSTHRVDFLPPAAMPPPRNKEIVKAHRSTHFDLGRDPADYTTTTAATFVPTEAARPTPCKQPPSSVQLGAADYKWKDNLKTTHRAAYTPPERDHDSLTEFVKNTPLCLGDDKRETMTEYRGAYKDTGFLDCTTLTDEQIHMLGVRREQLLPRKVPLPFLSSMAFKNSLGQPLQQ